MGQDGDMREQGKTRPDGGAKRPTIRDVASVAGVSYGTVSRFLNGGKWVSKSASDAIEAAIEETGYTANQQARSLATGRTDSIALVISGPHSNLFTDPTLATLVQGASHQAMVRNMTLIILLAGDDAERSHVESYLKAQHVDGVIMVSQQENDVLLEKLLDAGLPVVTLGQPLGFDERVRYVGIRERESARTMTRYLQGRGYTSIALISGPLNSAGGRLRREGFEAEMGELLDPTLLLESPYDLEGGHRAMVELLGREERPQAVFAASDVIARGALRAINESGLRIPDDIALASFDDADPATGVRMKLTTMRQPLRTISEAAVNLLVDQIDGEDADSRVLDTELVIGEST